MPKWLKFVVYALPPALVVGTLLVLSKGQVIGFAKHFVADGAYPGSSVSKSRELVGDDELLRRIVREEKYQDYRRRHPDFSIPVEEQITAPHSPADIASYQGFLGRFQSIIREHRNGRTDNKARAIIALVYEAYSRNKQSDREIDEGVLGGIKSGPEDYLFYLVNARTECGTVSEATVALMRDAGFKTRLVLLSQRPDPIEANHVFAEYFSEQQKRWVIVDPLVGFVGRDSAFELLNDRELSRMLNTRHKDDVYTSNSVIWFDRRGLFRKIFYYTPSEEARRTVGEAIARM